MMSPSSSNLALPVAATSRRTVISFLIASAAALTLVLSACGGSKKTAEGLEMYIADSVDTPPKIIGGMNKVYELTTYPQDAQEVDAYGTVWVRGIVTVRGHATRLRIVQGGHRSLERVALDVVSQLTFEPAKIDKGPVPSEVEIPVTFPPPKPEDES
ncbi:hypothetical protein CRI94_06695 [Longibacter salinarum]|uniref:TonB C-terminal domain-containing protein n=1 Tax=Longibacter salinarum TaxID=1850348 RepID=A0A2A8CYN7_9BACT|nr:energy transducer TonB [Longibacter salinarum]PEN13756.1 hypothetical protein CRI94_06695 [Longibacter salinarum]